MAYSIDPSVNWSSNWIFPLKTIFCNFQWQKLVQIQYLPHLMSLFFKIVFIKSYSLKAFQPYQEFAQLPYNFVFGLKWIFREILLKFLDHRSKHYETNLNVFLCMEGFPIVPRAWQAMHGLRDLNATKKKQTNNLLLSCIDRLSTNLHPSQLK